MINWIRHFRAFAIIGVVVLHVAAGSLSDEVVGSLNWIFANFYNSASRWCVPLFIMLSGALLLSNKKNESILEFYRKRAHKVLIPTITWTFVYLIWFFAKSSYKNEGYSTDLLILFFKGELYYHLWYIYMLVGFYVFAPFLRKFVNNLGKEELFFLVVISFILSISNEIAAIILKANNTFFMVKFISYMPYFIFGFYIFKYPPTVKHLKSTLVFLISIVATFTLYWIFTSIESSFSYYFYNYLSLNVVLMSLVLFIWGRGYLENKKVGFVTSVLDRNSFGVYLIHPIFLEVLRWFYGDEFRNLGWGTIPILSIVILFISNLVIEILQKSSYLRRIV